MARSSIMGHVGWLFIVAGLCAVSCGPRQLDPSVPMEDRPGCASAYDRDDVGQLDTAEVDGACKGDLPDCIAKCKANNMLSCATVAVRYLNGDGVQRDRAKGVELASLACRSGVSLVCSLAGSERMGLAHGDQQAEQSCKAFFDYANGCALGDIAACDALTRMPRDYLSASEAIETLRAADRILKECTTAKRREACLACTYRHFGAQPSQTDFHAVQNDGPCLQATCALGHDPACVGAIVARAEASVSKGDGRFGPNPPDVYVQARNQIAQMCDGGSPTACAYRSEVAERARERVAAWKSYQAETTSTIDPEAIRREHEQSLAEAEQQLKDYERRKRERPEPLPTGGGGLNERDKAILDNINKGTSLDSGCAGGYFYSHDVGNAIRSGYRCP